MPDDITFLTSLTSQFNNWGYTSCNVNVGGFGRDKFYELVKQQYIGISSRCRKVHIQWRNEAALCKKFSVKQVFSSAYRPHSQGCIERFNGTLKRLLYLHMARFKTKVWVDILDDVIANYRSMKHHPPGTRQHICKWLKMWTRYTKLERRFWREI